MKTINKKSKITIYWKIWRGVNKVTEDFSNPSTNLKVFLMGHDDVLVLNPSVNKDVDPGYEVLEMTISAGTLGVGAYGIKAVWTKNEGRDLLTSMRSGVFGITDSDAEASVANEEIRLVSSVESYGRDGMSAFETAVMRNLNNSISSEVEWVGNEAKRIADEEVRDVAEKARDKAEKAREGAEAERVETFNTNEETRQTTFETNETNRGATFTSNETNRENAYLSSEQNREVRFAAAEENRNKGEAVRQAAFEGGENNRETTFTRNEESRQSRFEDEVEQRAEAFNAYESSRQRAFEQAERDRGVLFRSKEDAREADELKRDQAEAIRNAQESVRQQAEQIRIDTFDENERGRIATFNANEAARIAAENERKQNEVQREANEAIRQESYKDKLPVSAVVQETGDGENVVMSQKAVSGKLAELESEVESSKIAIGTLVLEVQYFDISGENLKIGEVFFNTKTNLLRKRVGYEEYETIPFTYDYYYNVSESKYYIWNGYMSEDTNPTITEGLKQEVSAIEKAVDLVKEEIFGTPVLDVQFFAATGENLKIGEVFFNTKTNLLRKLVGNEVFETIPFIYDYYYNVSENKYYTWNTAYMVEEANPTITNGLKQELSEIENDVVAVRGEALGTPVLDVQFFATTGENLKIGEVFFNTKTDLLRKRVSYEEYETIPFIYDYYYNVSENKYYTWNTAYMVEEANPTITEGLKQEVSAIEKAVDLVKEEIFGTPVLDVQFFAATGENLKIGEVFFNTKTNLLRKLVGNEVFETIPFIYDYYYNVSENKYYTWNTAYMVEEANPTITEGLKQEVSAVKNDIAAIEKDVTAIREETFGTPVLDVLLFAATGEDVAIGEVFFNTRTNLLRKRVGYEEYETIPFIYDYYYNISENKYYTWNGSYMVEDAEPNLAKGLQQEISRAATSDIDDTILLRDTTWLATKGTFILGEKGGKLQYSTDLGLTWKEKDNFIGVITHVHWFTDDTCLICGKTKAYYTTNFIDFYETQIFDYDGSPFIGEDTHFFTISNYNSQPYYVDGKEMAIWCDYGNAEGYISRLWCSDDKGKTIKCILKNKESYIKGKLFTCTHFHGVLWDNMSDCLWITTGDYEDTSHFIKGIYNNGNWEFTILHTGPKFKFGQVLSKGECLYLITDYAAFSLQNGIVKVEKKLVENADAYQLIVKSNADNINLYEDALGKKILFPDSNPAFQNVFFYADGTLDFKPIAFKTPDNSKVSLHHCYGPNDRGELIAITSNRYGFATGISYRYRYLITTSIRKSHDNLFGRIKL